MDLPELRSFIGAFLDNVDLMSCVGVSKLWHESFIPLLYLTALEHQLRKHWTAFEPRFCHVRHLQFSYITEKDKLNSILKNCTHLRRLSISFSVYDYQAKTFLWDLVTGNPQLVRLSIDGTLPPAVYLQLLKVVLEHCPRLTELELSSASLQGNALNRFLDLAPRLTRLKLKRCRTWEPKVSWANWPPFPELRDLTLQFDEDFLPWEDQLRLFERADKLESLSWHYEGTGASHRDEFMQGLDVLLCEGAWPRLVSLQLTEPQDGSMSVITDTLLARVLEHCPKGGLRRLILPWADFADRSWKAFGRHSKTIQDLTLSTSSWTTQDILTSCPELVEFHGATLASFDLVDGFGNERYREMVMVERMRWAAEEGQLVQSQAEGDPGTSEESLSPSTFVPPSPTRPWVCDKLRVFKVLLRKLPEEEPGAIQQVFDRFAKLHRLEELHLCPIEKRYGFGLDPRIPLGLNQNENQYAGGEYGSASLIRKEAVGRRLLEIWPELKSCNLCLFR